MANITLGAVELTLNPVWDKALRKKKLSSFVETFGGVQYFAQGLRYEGVIVSLSWTYLPLALFDSIDSLYAADAPVVFDPQDGSGKTFNVEITSFDGTYYLKDTINNLFTHRKDVTLKLIILSEV